MAETIDLVLSVKAQADQAKSEIEKIIESFKAMREVSTNPQDRAALEQQIKLYQNMAVEIDKASKALNTMDVKSKLEALKGMADKFKEATKELKSFADGSVEAARAISLQEKIIKNTSDLAGKSAEDTRKTLDYIKEYSMSKQPFKIEDIYQASAQLNKFRLSVQDTLPLVANLAATFDNDLVRASQAVSWALTDTGRGISILQRDYSMTKDTFR